MTPTDQIRQRLEQKREELRKQEAVNEAGARKAELIKAEIAGWEGAFRLLETTLDSVTVHVNSSAAAVTAHARSFRPANTIAFSNAAEVARISEDSRRGPKEPWRSIMPEMAVQYPRDDFGLQDVVALADLMTTPVKIDNVRSQMANYVNTGVLERIANGRFKFTDAGRVEFFRLQRQLDSPGRMPSDENTERMAEAGDA